MSSSSALPSDLPLSVSPATAKLDAHFSIAPFGGDTIMVYDINGDGQDELLVLQSPGQFATRLAAGRTDLDDVDRKVFCLTAVDMQGRVLWQYGEPYGRDFPYTSHGTQGGQMLAADDIDGDGRVEVIVIRGSQLLVIDGKTGALLRSVSLPSDNFCMVATAQMGNPEYGKQILCKVNDLAYEPWDYANPMVIYNADLSIYREPFAVTGAGHNFVIKDMNGDGRDEVFVGYSMLNADGSCAWTLDLGEGFDYAEDHADQIELADINGDGHEELRYAGSEDFYVCNTDGQMIWQLPAGHSQQSAAGRWAHDGTPRIILAEKNDGLAGVSPEGEFLWRRRDINGYVAGNLRWPDSEGKLRDWALFRPQLVPLASVPCTSDPAWSRELWPSLMDGEGRRHDFLPWHEDYAHRAQTIRAARSYDCGLKFYPIPIPATGGHGDSGCHDRLMVHTREDVWFFTA